jgi:glycosyltransferase involved in cell wall biosynthesis
MTSTSGERQLWVWYTPFGLGGVETFLLNHARCAAAGGTTTWIAAVQNTAGLLRDDFCRTGAHTLDWTAFYGAFMNQTSAKSVQQMLINDLITIRPTVLALNDCTDFALGAAPLLRRLRPFCTIIDTLHIDAPDDGYLQRRRACLDVYDGVAATNQNILERFRNAYPRTAMTTRYISNGVHVPLRSRRPADQVLRLLYVGRLAQEQKRILELPGILKKLRSSGRLFEVTVLGDGPQRNELADLLNQSGLSESVRLAGCVPPGEAVEQYFTHDVVLNLSDYEGFSMTILEALGAGCVPVCTDLPCLDRAVFQDGVNCRLCPANDLGRMSDILAGLWPNDLAQLSTGARSIGSKFTATKMSSDYAALVAELRERRPLQPWPDNPRNVLSGVWDMTRHNPWIPHPNPVKKLLRRICGQREPRVS